MINEEVTVISQCIERKSTAPFFRLCMKFVREELPIERLDGIGTAARLTPQQIGEHIKAAQEIAPRISQPAPKRVLSRLPSGSTPQEKLLRMRMQKAKEDQAKEDIEAIVSRCTLGPKTAGKIKAALLDIWRNPEQYADSPAWKALTNDRTT